MQVLSLIVQQLTGLDAAFLYSENDRMQGHVTGLLVLDPSTRDEPFTLDVLREHVRQRLPLLPPLRWRLVEVPLGIDLPSWADDPDVDLDYHVREIALAAPGNDQQLSDQVARIAERRLDRRRPLWEMYLIHGLPDGHVGILTKLHHAAVDGAAAMQILAAFLETTPDGGGLPPAQDPAQDPAQNPVQHPTPSTIVHADSQVALEQVPGRMAMLTRGARGLLARPGQLLRLQARLLTSAEGRREILPRLKGVTHAVVHPRIRTLAPRTSFNRTVSAHRRWAFASLSLDELKAVKNATGVTLNDVVLTVCASALRRWLLDHDELPADPLLAMVPVSVRTDAASTAAGNEVSMVIVPIPTHLETPAERLAAAHQAMAEAKEEHRLLPVHLVQDLSRFSTPLATELVARTLSGLRVADHLNPPFNVTISNVPGPRQELYYAGARVVANYPVSIVGDGVGLNITVQSYLDRLDVGLMACRELVPDVWILVDHLREALRELLELASAGGLAEA